MLRPDYVQGARVDVGERYPAGIYINDGNHRNATGHWVLIS